MSRYAIVVRIYCRKHFNAETRKTQSAFINLFCIFQIPSPSTTERERYGSGGNLKDAKKS